MKQKILSLNSLSKGLLIPLILFPAWIILYNNLQNISDFITENIIQLSPGEHLTETIRFFIFEVPKVT